ncbi:uncharacterized protein RCO7_02420 [Rhynchosporium graminicola]|uniref:Uncharacterized protein n=1 Tax=Rhynchosporium graminicola TaxID=2792576 RepID=A0A1E1JZX9_9HELO|nr:uncharacterized protein RCO7_02420 [Rhynchosporium commune]
MLVDTVLRSRVNAGGSGCDTEGDDVLGVVREKIKSSAESQTMKASKWQRMRNVGIKEGRLKGWKVFDAWMEGADAGDLVRAFLEEEKDRKRDELDEFENLCTGQKLQNWAFKDDFIAAQAYLGGMSIAKELLSVRESLMLFL